MFLFEDGFSRLLGSGVLLLLTLSAGCLVMAFGISARGARQRALPGTAWLQSFGRLSYEIYLTHMFVVFTVVRIFAATGHGLRFGCFWYIPAIALSALLGFGVDRLVSSPSNRALRKRLIRP